MTFVDDIFSQTIIVFSTFGCISHTKGREKVREVVCMNELPCQQLSTPVSPMFLMYLSWSVYLRQWILNPMLNYDLSPINTSEENRCCILQHNPFLWSTWFFSFSDFFSTYSNTSVIPCMFNFLNDFCPFHYFFISLNIKKSFLINFGWGLNYIECREGNVSLS